MTLGLEDKKAIVAQIHEIAKSSLSAVVADYHGLTVDQMTDLRCRARKQGVYLRVIRNTLVKRAIHDTDYQCLDSVMVGPTILAFSQEDPGAAARIFKEFAKDNKKLEVKALSIGGQLMYADQLDKLASLPTLDQARAQLLNVMLAPITKLVRTFNEIPTKATRVISAIATSKKS
ncbi:MAG: 50S ribosomal protein L10 [Endozoicomonadaceae bacterium]|nr:50S ribosomal protein L10 [Endozoicomonadaceae bacterium]